MATACSAAALLALAFVIAGCSLHSGKTLSADPTPTGSLGDAVLADPSPAAEAWRRNPSDKQSGLDYARGLMTLERPNEAVKVVEELARRNPGDLELAAYLGKIMVRLGRVEDGGRELRRALALPKGTGAARLRQNLALVVGLQGRFDEARKIASRDLPADQVEANAAYLKHMLAEPDPWEQLRAAQ